MLRFRARRRRLERLADFAGIASGIPFNARFADAGGGGGGSDDIQKRIDEAVERATAPLKANRDQILEEKKKLRADNDALSASIAALGGPDGIKALTEQRERLSKDELGKLLAEGKHDEWFDRRVGALRKDYDTKLTAAEQRAKELEKERDSARTAYSQKEVDTAILGAAGRAKLVETAIDDALLRGRSIFAFDPESRRVVMRDADGSIVTGKDGKTPKSPDEWMEDMKEKARHWFPGSRGAGAGDGMGSDGPTDAAKVGSMSMEEYRAYRQKQGMGTGWAGGHA